MACMKQAGLKSSGQYDARSGKRYGSLQPFRSSNGSILAAFRFARLDKPSPGFAERVMRQIK